VLAQQKETCVLLDLAPKKYSTAFQTAYNNTPDNTKSICPSPRLSFHRKWKQVVLLVRWYSKLF